MLRTKKARLKGVLSFANNLIFSFSRLAIVFCDCVNILAKIWGVCKAVFEGYFDFLIVKILPNLGKNFTYPAHFLIVFMLSWVKILLSQRIFSTLIG
ncbi:hypothetical protein HMPREF9996_01761 [Aggregatibacter actinomycetemcomitans Y4]|uniref:hypothetical protein n=1 Tax=Aggregatibacter aphrophilus TaxID=732 RepID=UPI0002A1B094|nr:hypothetical protein [Aggregatibacter aphrophilus]EKX94662.1 hypothetical protein HMPREF9996_01761 [Aggregatibacter actinomycetemcomitans Y4]